MQGIIEKVTDDTLEIRIKCMSSCECCSGRENCGIKSQISKILKIKADVDNKKYREGQEVELSVSLKTGIVSLFFAYILPLILVVSVLCISLYFTNSETASAIYSLSILFPYYFLLFYLNSWLKKRLEIKIK